VVAVKTAVFASVAVARVLSVVVAAVGLVYVAECYAVVVVQVVAVVAEVQYIVVEVVPSVAAAAVLVVPAELVGFAWSSCRYCALVVATVASASRRHCTPQRTWLNGTETPPIVSPFAAVFSTNPVARSAYVASKDAHYKTAHCSVASNRREID
jgi:hypothetical protein